jgi:hypothetical protein
MIEESWLHLQAFIDILLTRNVLTEVAGLGVCVSLGWLAAVLLRDREPLRVARPAVAWSGDIFAHIVFVALPAVVVLGFVLLARGILYAAHFDVTILDAAVRLVGAYVGIRVGVLCLRSVWATSPGCRTSRAG